MSILISQFMNLFIQRFLDPDNVFLVDPIAAVIRSNESILFTVRFR